MADVTINITGNSNGARNALDNAAGSGGTGGTPPVVPPTTPPTTPPTGGGGTNPPTGGNAPLNPGNNTPVIPTYDRMAQDIRREMLSRGALMVPGSANFNQLMSTVQQQQRTAAYQSIEDKYVQGVNQTQQELENKRKTELDRLEQERQDKLARAVTPNAVQRINERYDRLIERKNDSIEIEKATAFTQLGQERENDKAKVEQDLAKIAAELVQELRQGNPNSYLGRLRQQYREATWRRDNAETEEEAQEAGEEASRIQRRMSRAMAPTNRLAQAGALWGGISGVLNTANNATNAYFQNTAMKISELNSAANGDAFGAMQQDFERRKMSTAAWGSGIGAVLGGILGGIGAALSSWGIGTGAGIAGGAALGGVAGGTIGSTIFNWTHGSEGNQLSMAQMWQQNEQRMQQFNDLALITSRFSGQGLNDERQTLLDNLGEVFVNGYGLQGYDLGYTNSQLSSVLRRRALQRGFIGGDSYGYIPSSDGGDTDVLPNLGALLTQDALERVYNLSEGAIGQYSKYDRYSRQIGRNRVRRNDANQDIANLIASLDNAGVLGMSGGQRLRADEFLGYQTQLMEMQKGWMSAPNSEYATRMLLAGQRQFGDNFDSRHIQQIGQIENAITHPKEDYSKAILYDVIQNIFPETRGNLLAIRQKQFSDNPEERRRINREMFNRLTQVYGGVDTTSGYLALSHYTGIERPQDLQNWVDALSTNLPTVTKGNVANDVEPLKELLPDVSKDMLRYQDKTTQKIADSLVTLNGLASQLLSSFNKQIDKIIQELK